MAKLVEDCYGQLTADVAVVAGGGKLGPFRRPRPRPPAAHPPYKFIVWITMPRHGRFS